MLLRNPILFFYQVLYFCREIYRHFEKVQGYQRASALAFTSLLSLVPLMTVSFTLLSAFPFFQAVSLHIQTFILNNFVIAAGQEVQSYLLDFTEKARHLSAIGLLFLVLTAISMMFTIENAFNAIWQVKQRRSWLAGFMLYWTMLTVSPLLLGIGFAISSYLTSLSLFHGNARILGLTEKLLSLMPFVLSVCTFTLLYSAVPNRRVPIKAAFFAGILASLFFEAAKCLFTIYIAKFAAYQLLYGVLAAIPIFLLWIYLCWFITLFGAVLSYFFAYNRYSSMPSVSGLHDLQP